MDSVLGAFSRAAHTYDTGAEVQAEAAGRLLEILPKRDYLKILEIGCGTGILTQGLAGLFPDAGIVALDGSEEMIQVAREKRGLSGVCFTPSCLDAFHLAGHSFDLVVSSSALHWMGEPGELFARISSGLSPGCVVAFCMFGPRSLEELQEAGEMALGQGFKIAARGFFDAAEVREAFSRAFSLQLFEQKVYKRTYPDLVTLVRRLKASGVVPRGGHVPMVRSPGAFMRLEEAYRKNFGEIRASYQLFFMIGAKS